MEFSRDKDFTEVIPGTEERISGINDVYYYPKNKVTDCPYFRIYNYVNGNIELFEIDVYYGENPGNSPKSISIKTSPADMNLNIGDTIDFSGMVANITYESGMVKEVTYTGNEDKFSFSATTITNLGANDITVFYTENNITVNVKATFKTTQVINKDSTDMGESKTGTYKSNSDNGYYKKVEYDPIHTRDNFTGNYLIVYKISSTSGYVFDGSQSTSNISKGKYISNVPIDNDRIFNGLTNYSNNEWKIEINSQHADEKDYYMITSVKNGYQLGIGNKTDSMDYWNTKSKEENINYVNVNTDSTIDIKSLYGLTMTFNDSFNGFRYENNPGHQIYLYQWCSYSCSTNQRL